MIQRDDMGWEVGGGFRIGNSCTPVADSCQCMAKPIQYCKIKLKKNKKQQKKTPFQEREKREQMETGLLSITSKKKNQKMMYFEGRGISVLKYEGKLRDEVKGTIGRMERNF